MIFPPCRARYQQAHSMWEASASQPTRVPVWEEDGSGPGTAAPRGTAVPRGCGFSGTHVTLHLRKQQVFLISAQASASSSKNSFSFWCQLSGGSH